MPVAELVYFHGAHFQHIVDFRERERLADIARRSRIAALRLSGARFDRDGRFGG